MELRNLGKRRALIVKSRKKAYGMLVSLTPRSEVYLFAFWQNTLIAIVMFPIRWAPAKELVRILSKPDHSRDQNDAYHDQRGRNQLRHRST